jgi:hypothetical protein
VAAIRSGFPVTVASACDSRGAALSDKPASTARNKAAEAPIPQDAIRISDPALNSCSPGPGSIRSGAIAMTAPSDESI